MLADSAKNQEGNRVGRLLRTWRFMVVNLAVFCLVAWGLVGEWIRNYHLATEVSAKVQQADEMQDAYIKAAESARLLESGALAEREARLKLNLQKPGERVVVIRGSGVDSTASTVEDEVVSEEPVIDESNIVGWWRYFFQ
jgi:cell division protein FtsB